MSKPQGAPSHGGNAKGEYGHKTNGRNDKKPAGPKPAKFAPTMSTYVNKNKDKYDPEKRKNLLGKKAFRKPNGESQPYNPQNNQHQEKSHHSEGGSQPQAHHESSESYKERPRKFEGPEAKKQRKLEVKLAAKERKMLKPNAPLVAEALRLWSLFMQKTTPEEEKHQLIEQCLKETKGRIADIVFRGTASRVFQGLWKVGNEEQRAQVFEELKDRILDMSKNVFAFRMVKSMLKRGTAEQVDFIVKKYYGHVCNLMRQRDASQILEYIFSTPGVGTPNHKQSLVEEFYGVEFETFKAPYRRTLTDILQANPERQGAIVAHMRAKLMPIILKADMSMLLNHTILHTPLCHLFELSSFGEKDALIDALKDNIVRIVHSRDGAALACQCIAYATQKQRKAIVKSMKGFVKQIALESHGYIVLIRLFDVIDDTVLVAKNIISELKPHLLELATDTYGHRVLLSLLAPKNPRYFERKVLAHLTAVSVPERPELDEDGKPVGGKPSGPQKLVPTSKKDPEIRYVELYNAIIPDLRELVTKQCFRLLTDTAGRDIVFETISTSAAVLKGEEKDKLYKIILRLVGLRPKTPKGEGMDVDENTEATAAATEKDSSDVEDEDDDVARRFHALDFMREKPTPEEDAMTHHFVHRTVRRFVDDDPGFDELLLKKLGAEGVWKYTTLNFSPWIIYSLLLSPSTKDKVKKILVPHSKEMIKIAESGDPAAAALQSILKALGIAHKSTGSDKNKSTIKKERSKMSKEELAEWHRELKQQKEAKKQQRMERNAEAAAVSKRRLNVPLIPDDEDEAMPEDEYDIHEVGEIPEAVKDSDKHSVKKDTKKQSKASMDVDSSDESEEEVVKKPSKKRRRNETSSSDSDSASSSD